MVSIEDLRREEEIRQEPQRRYEEEGLRKLKKQADMLATSKKHFKESGIADLCNKLFKIFPKKEMILENKTPYSPSDPEKDYTGNDILEITVDGRKFNYYGRTEYPDGRKYFQIITTPAGEIVFKGDKDNGLSAIPKDIWTDNKQALEEALVKAFKNPIREYPRKPPEVGRGEDPTGYSTYRNSGQGF